MTDRQTSWPPSTEALKPLIEAMARASARSAHELDIEFDMDDPQVARDVILTAFNGLFLSGKPVKLSAAGLKAAEEGS